MVGAVPDGTITQPVHVPELPATLTFKLREITGLGSLSMMLQVKYAGEVIDEVATAAGETFQPESASIPASLVGPSARPLVFSVTCFNFTVSTGNCPRFDFDDVSLTTGASSTLPGGGSGGGAGEAGAPAAAADKTPPQTKIKSGPGKDLSQGKAKFVLSSSEPGSSFACKLDKKKAVPCRSPKSYSGLKPGHHTFQVWATDAAGNKDPTPAKRRFRVPAA